MGVEQSGWGSRRPTAVTPAKPSIFCVVDIETIFEGPKKLRRNRAAT
jgi:hypothetical protein